MMDEKLRLPRDVTSFDELVESEAGRAFILSQLDPKSDAIRPTHTFRSSSRCDSVWYEVYDDDSLWFNGNDGAQIWSDFRDFVYTHLDGFGRTEKGLCWTEEEREASTQPFAWVIEEIDKELAILSYEGDEAAARAAVMGDG